MVSREAPHNLPSRLTSFVGRERELREVGELLGAHRLVTLVGAPGVGKTRLSLAVAWADQARFPDGVWLVELAPLADPALVPHAVADVLGVREQPGRTLTATLAGYLRARRLLLVLDNCEHLIAAAATCAETLLLGCPNLNVLATSREPLAVEGEVTYRVPSLTVSTSDAEAVTLFVDRGRAADPTFALTERSAPTVAQICTRLDGIPLAIELAAARVRALSVEQIAARLDDRFRLLTGGSRTALPRQQTLRGAVNWSYDLLSEPEQRLLRHLAVFAGGFTLEAAECFGSSDALVSLVDKSLVQVDDGPGDGERRYRLLETLRQYGHDKLIEHGELEAARDRHRDYFCGFVEALAPFLRERPDRSVLNQTEQEHDNLRVALGWSFDGSTLGQDRSVASDHARNETGAALSVRLAAAIWPFWWLRGHVGEGRRWLARALAVPARDTSPAGLAGRATALMGIAQLSMFQGDYRAAAAYMFERLELCREISDDHGVVSALQRLGYYLAHLGEGERATQFCAESVALGRRVGNRRGLAIALQTSGMVARMQGRPEQSVTFLEEAISLHREVGNFTIMAYALRAQCYAVEDLGDTERALALSEEGLCISQEAGDKRGTAESLKNTARFALLAGDTDRAIESVRMALNLLHLVGDPWLTSICLEILAGVRIVQEAHARGSGDLAGPAGIEDESSHLLDPIRLYAWAELMREQSGLDPPPEMRGAAQRNLAELRERLGEAAFCAARDEGRAMSFDEVFEYALQITAPITQAAAPTPAVFLNEQPGAVPLTPREREVATLVARGLTNRQIAAELVVSERTVHSHVRNLLDKLQVSSRAQVAVWAVEHGIGTSAESPTRRPQK